MNRSLLDHQPISYRYFSPTPCRFPEPRWIDAGDAHPGCRQFCSYPADFTIVHFHGNGETVADYLDDWHEYFGVLGEFLGETVSP